MSLREVFPNLTVVLILGGGFYAIVLYPFELDQLVKGSIIGMMATAVQFVFGQGVAKATATATTKALNTSVPPTFRPVQSASTTDA